MARLFGLVCTLVFGQGIAQSTSACDAAYQDAQLDDCFDVRFLGDNPYDIAFPGGGNNLCPLCNRSLGVILATCGPGYRTNNATNALNLCKGPEKLNCTQAHNVFNFLGCKEGFASMCGDKCRPLLRRMSDVCSAEMVEEEDGIMINLNMVATISLESCTDPCMMAVGQISGDQQEGVSCSAMTETALDVLRSEPCASKTLPNATDSSGAISITFGEFASHFGHACHPCYELYSAWHASPCSSSMLDCAGCRHRVQMMEHTPECMGDDVYREAVEVARDVLHYQCEPMPENWSMPEKKCVKVPAVLRKGYVWQDCHHDHTHLDHGQHH